MTARKMRFRVRVRVRWFSVGPWGQLAQGAQGPALRNMRFRVDRQNRKTAI